jgi:hypothetical protein
MKPKVKVEIKSVKPLKTSLFTKKPLKSYVQLLGEFVGGSCGSPPAYCASYLPSLVPSRIGGQIYTHLWQKALRNANFRYRNQFMDTPRNRMIWVNKPLILLLLFTPVYFTHAQIKFLGAIDSTNVDYLRKAGIVYWYPKLGWHLHPSFAGNNPLKSYLDYAIQLFDSYVSIINTQDEIL